LLSTGGRVESRQVEVSEISRKLKELARELEMPVYCLAQLNRGVEGRADNRPRISDLRESGAIEQDADVIILLHREEYYHLNDPSWLQDPDNRDKIGVSELIVAKHRNGPTGVVKMTWDAECARFKPLAKPYMSEVEEAWVQGDLR
jgi:replicative DNA helicase